MKKKTNFKDWLLENNLIIPKDSEPFLTKWFQYENHYSKGMVVYDLYSHLYTKNGEDWDEIQLDHL